MIDDGPTAQPGLSALAYSHRQGNDRMSKFLDRMEQIGRGTQAPLGFGVARPEKIPGMALVGLITSNYSTGVSAVAELAPDAALVAGGPGPASVSELAEPLGSALPWGVRATSMTPEEVQAYQESGCDLLAFPLEGTPVSAVASDEIARILCVDPGIEERELRAIMALPVDMLLLSMSGHSGPWTLSELAAVGSVSRRAGGKVHSGGGLPTPRWQRIGGPARYRRPRFGGGRGACNFGCAGRVKEKITGNATAAAGAQGPAQCNCTFFGFLVG